MRDKYQEMLDQAAAEYAAVNGRYKEEAATAREASYELAELEAEAENLRGKIADFEAGKIVIGAQEYVQIEDRRRWLAIRIKQQTVAARQAQRAVELAAAGVQGVHAKYHGKLAQMLEEDARAAAAARRAELVAVLRG